MSNTLTRAQRLIINEMPPHNLFLELFLGDKPLMRLKRSALINIGVDSDPAAVERAGKRFQQSGFSFLQDDVIAFLRRYEWLHSEGNELVFCSPPRLGSSRHRECTETYQSYLLETLRELPCMVMVAGTPSDLYEHTLADWRSIPYKGADGVEEFLWMNFPQPFELHDYRFIGRDAHERDQLKRKAERWGQRLDDMPPLERYALLNALRERGARLGKR